MGDLPVPRNLGEITPAWLTQALREGGVGPDIEVVGCSAEVIAEGAGFMNQVFRLSLDYRASTVGLPPTIIAKLPSVDPLLKTVFDRLGQNRREVYFYRDLAPNEHLLTPACYHAGLDPTDGDTALLLEDMRGARQGDSVAGCSLADAELAIRQLARFQADWWDSARMEALDWMPLKDAETDAYLETYPDAWRSLCDKAGCGMPAGLRRLGDRLIASVPEIKARLTMRPRTIVHGDFRLDNCFFSDDAFRPPTVLDWEFCVRGRGVCDVATFVGEAFPPAQRREVESGLVGIYHAALADSGVSGYSFENCWDDYRLAALEIFVFWIIAGGYCNYEDPRAKVYLHNTLARFDAAIAELRSMELLSA